MRDLKLITPTDPEAVWSLDFDIIDGRPQFVPYDRNTQDQRAAVAAYMSKGTVPGKPDLGINWAGLYSGSEETMINIDNEIKRAIQQYAGIPEGPNSTYVPLYEIKDGKIQLGIFQG